jgi:hypothetical protein
MKWFGLALTIFGAWWAYLWWPDPVEGVYMRPFGMAVGIVGAFVIILGVRNDIVRAIRERDRAADDR